MSSKYMSEPGATTEFPEMLDAIKSGDFLPYMAELKTRASTGDTPAAIALGHIFFKGGRGVRKDYVAARHWWQKVRLEDDVTGFVANRLATIYYKGHGVSKNHHTAYKYLRSACLHGHRTSMVVLAMLYKRGDGTLKRPRAAKILLKASVADPKVGNVMRFFALVFLL